MLDRAAIAFAPLRMVCAAMLVLLIAHIDMLAPAFTPQVSTQTASAAEATRCTHHSMRTRSSGLHTRFLTRELASRRPLQPTADR